MVVVVDVVLVVDVDVVVVLVFWVVLSLLWVVLSMLALVVVVSWVVLPHPNNVKTFPATAPASTNRAMGRKTERQKIRPL